MLAYQMSKVYECLYHDLQIVLQSLQQDCLIPGVLMESAKVIYLYLDEIALMAES